MFHHAQNYPLIPTVKNGTRLHPQHNLCSEEHTRSTYDLYMTRELVRNEYNEVRGFYRLHAKNTHTLDMALVYDIECPKCGNLLKQVGHCLNDHELGIYACRVCDKKKGGF